MTRWLPRRAAGQLVALLIAVLLLAQGITFWILADERQGALRSARLSSLLERVGNAHELVALTDTPQHPTVLSALSDATLALSIDAAPRLKRDTDDELSRWLARRADLPEGEVRSRFTGDGCDGERDHGRRDDDHDDDHDEDDDDGRLAPYGEAWHERDERDGCRPSLEVAMPLDGGAWLNAVARPPGPSWLWLKAALLSAGITAVLLVASVSLAVRRLLAPLQALREAAHGFARGETVDVRERGPEDIRDVIHAFNRMQRQVGQAQEDKARLLAALAHDLRTPITAMRLRVELLPEGEDRTRLLATLAEMQQLAESTLDFIRGSVSEASRRYDLGALLESLCEDLRELSLPVEGDDYPRCILEGRPDALRRALRNLVENAVQHGGSAEVTLDCDATICCVRVADRGPGIPASLREQVFEPFFRIEASRSRTTGGAGLGLAIARTLVRGMGGEIDLHERSPGPGLVVEVTLPR